MSKVIIFIIVFFLILPFSFASNTTWYSVELAQGGASTMAEQSVGGSTYTFCTNITRIGMSNTTPTRSLAINFSVGHAGGNGNIEGIQFCEPAAGGGGACDCLTGTIKNITFNGNNRNYALSPGDSISDTINFTYDLSNEKSYWIRWKQSGEFGDWTRSGQSNTCVIAAVSGDSLESDSWTLAAASCGTQAYSVGSILVLDLDSTPPSITYFNLTSSNYGCESWNTDKNTACNTSSVTPTVQFNTSENAWCAIAGSINTTALDKNYTEMGSSRNCTGAASGEGTKEHFCTLTNQDELFYDLSYLLISCKDTLNNQNKTSTSGALKLNVSGLEGMGRNSFEVGVRNALSNSYSVYTDQKVYERNSANSQIIGRFDKVAKKLNKIWAFNRVDVTESFVNMFNITPVFYTLEISNKTSVQIINETELLINSTK